jgi:hypothetical protein
VNCESVAEPNRLLGLAQVGLSLAGGLLLWWLAFPVMRLPVPVGVLFMAAFLTAGSYALNRLWEGRRSSSSTARRPGGNGDAMRQRETPLHAFRSRMADVAEAHRRRLDEDFTKWVTKRQQPYHVAWVGHRLTITPPLLPVVSRISEALGLRKSWSFSPGDAERAWSWGSKRSKVTRYAVDSVEIAHDTWTSGRGVTDRLKIRGPQYSSVTVAALDHYNLGNVQYLKGFNGAGPVSPTLAGSAADRGLPAGVGEVYASDVIATVAPTILALSRMITDATRRPLAIVVGSCREPNHD